MKKPVLGKLDKAEKLRYYNPLPPEILVSALQDPIHKDLNIARPAKLAKKSKPTTIEDT